MRLEQLKKLMRSVEVQLHPVSGMMPTEGHDQSEVLNVLNSIRATGIVQYAVTLFSYTMPNGNSVLLILDGHHRIAASIKLGLSQLPSVVLDSYKLAALGELGKWWRHVSIDPIEIIALTDSVACAVEGSLQVETSMMDRHVATVMPGRKLEAAHLLTGAPTSPIARLEMHAKLWRAYEPHLLKFIACNHIKEATSDLEAGHSMVAPPHFSGTDLLTILSDEAFNVPMLKWFRLGGLIAPVRVDYPISALTQPV